jgi:dolichol kinase
MKPTKILTFGVAMIGCAIFFKFPMVIILFSVGFFIYTEIQIAKRNNPKSLDVTIRDGVAIHIKDYWWMKTFRWLMASGEQKRNNIQRGVLTFMWVPAILLAELLDFPYLAIFLAGLMLAGAAIALLHHFVQRHQLRQLRKYVHDKSGIWYHDLSALARTIGYLD